MSAAMRTTNFVRHMYDDASGPSVAHGYDKFTGPNQISPSVDASYTQSSYAQYFRIQIHTTAIA
jgi:hypothetical protein